VGRLHFIPERTPIIMRITLAAITLALAVFAPTGASAQTSTPFDGKWEGTFTLKNTDGTERPPSTIIFNLTQKGKELSGTAGPPNQEEKVVGTVADGKATFEVIMPQGPPFKFSLTIVKGRLQGDMTREQNGTVRQAKVDAAKAAPEKK
jgi:hypothetical protein